MKLRSFISLVVRRYLCRRLRGFCGNPWSIDPTDAEELAAYLEGGTTTGSHSFTHTEYHRYLDEVLRILHGELNERDWRIFVKLYIKHETPGRIGLYVLHDLVRLGLRPSRSEYQAPSAWAPFVARGGVLARARHANRQR